MDDFIEFNLIQVDATAGGKVQLIGPVRERVDLIARQFRDFLRGSADEQAHGIMLTNEFKLRRHVTPAAGWLSFLADVGDGKEEKLDEVAVIAFVREKGADADEALRRTGADLAGVTLPAPPFAVAVKVSKEEPFVVREWYTKAAAGFFA
jgi:hypothetical protein